MQLDYDDLLNTSWENIPEPVNLPGGSYLIKGANVAFVKAKEEGKPHKVLFSYNAQSPVAVDEDALAELPEGYEIETNDLTYTVFIEKAADWNNVRKHLELHGIELTGGIFENGKLSFAKAFRGAEIVAEVGQRFYTNAAGDSIPQNTLSKFQRVE